MALLTNFKKFLIGASIGFILIGCQKGDSSYEPLPKKVDFNFDIRPILVQNCYLCHGPDISSREANLRLDIYDGATAELRDGGYAVVPGKPSSSEMIKRINHADESEMMPPPETNYKLSRREKDLIEKWIAQGAEWKPHWSFIRPNLTADQMETASIDQYLDQVIADKNLVKSPKANRNQLIRRVSYILTGLPPSPESINNYLADTSPKAYDKMVDSYLEDSSFGERWARHWMDLVRYAETRGHEFDYTITGAWKYRDYLIKAFNEDLPYDELLKEHLAGDLIEPKRYDPSSGISQSHIATAFYTLGEGTHSPVDIRKDEANRIDNMIDVTTKTFQGLTVACAKCHDHKFDPIPTKDYYALYGIMESTRFTPLDATLSKPKEIAVNEILKIQDYIKSTVNHKIDQKNNRDINSGNNSELIKNESYKIIGDFRKADFGHWIPNGHAFGHETTLGKPVFQKTTGQLIAFEDGYASSKLLNKGIHGNLRSPNFILDSEFIGVRARGHKATIRIIIDNFQLIQNPIYGNLAHGINDPKWHDYEFNIGAWKGHKAYIEIIPGEFNRHDYTLSDTAFVEAQYAISFNDKWPVEVIKTGSDQQIVQLNRQLKNGSLKLSFPELIPALDSINLLAKNIYSDSFVYGVSDGFATNSPVFIRGNHTDLSDETVPRRFLTALPGGGVAFKTKGSGRLALAEAMLEKENPLTARVMVNRVWHHLFGRGIVETVDNFGLQGKLPSHPELLDYLAIKFQKQGWSIKKLIKEIVSSEAFQRSTIPDENSLSLDPNNIYLAAFPVRRLESEAIRDGLLMASKSLNDTMYGPPVPAFLTPFMNGRGRPGKSGPLDGRGRRSIYQEVRRNFLEPMMTTFDRPLPYTTFGKRDITNVPAQSLILMNDPFVMEQATIMAKKLLIDENLSFDKRIIWIYKHALSRNPLQTEIDEASRFIKSIEKLQKTETTKSNVELQVWAAYCHSIFNLKEFIYLI